MGIGIYVLLVLAIMLINDIRGLVWSLGRAERVGRTRNLCFLAGKYALIALCIAYLAFTRPPTLWDLVGTGIALVGGILLLVFVTER